MRAILLDPEARGGVKTAPDFGTLREPVLMVTALLRALYGVTDGAQLSKARPATSARARTTRRRCSTTSCRTPKVPGTSLLGPEFGIHTTVTAVGRANLIYALVYGGYAADANIPDASGTRLFLAPFEALADNPAAMVSLINQQLGRRAVPGGARAHDRDGGERRSDERDHPRQQSGPIAPAWPST